jgi:hypothetical protein
MRRWRTDTGPYDTPYLFAAVFQFPILVVPFLPGASQKDLKKNSTRLLCDITTSDWQGGILGLDLSFGCHLRGPYLGTPHPQALYTKPFRKRVSA